MLKLFAALSSTFKRRKYFGPIKLFSDLYLSKFLDIITLAKSFFLYNSYIFSKQCNFKFQDIPAKKF